MKSSETLIRRPDVEAMTGLRRSTLYAMAATGDFPKPIKIGERASAWRTTEVEAWIARRIRNSNSPNKAADADPLQKSVSAKGNASKSESESRGARK